MRLRPIPSSLAALAAALLSLAAACRSRDAEPPAAPASARSYTVRGEVVGLPPAGGPRQLLVRHEPIDDFADASGKVVGMDSMVMTFVLSPSVSAEGLRVGDRVEAVLAVDFSRPMLRIDSLRRLDPGTPLRFGKATPGAPR